MALGLFNLSVLKLSPISLQIINLTFDTFKVFGFRKRSDKKLFAFSNNN